MSTSPFASILAGATLGSIEKPKPLPAGGYIAVVKNVEFGESKGEKKTPYARVNFELLQALDDVDQAELEAAGGINGKKVRTDFYLTDASLFRFQDFILKDCALELNGMTLDQAIPQLTNQTCGVRIKQEISTKNAEDIFAIVDGTFNPNA